MKSSIIFVVAIFVAFFLQSCYVLHDVPGAKYYPKINLDTLNKYDGNKHRTGYWLDYLNKDFLPPENKKDVAFFRYEYYENGREVFPCFEIYFQNKNILKIEDTSYVARKDTIVLLSGKYQVYNKKGILLEEEYYANGIPQHSKIYYENGHLLCEQKQSQDSLSSTENIYYENGKLQQHIAYTKGKLVSNILYNKKGELVSYKIYDNKGKPIH